MCADAPVIQRRRSAARVWTVIVPIKSTKRGKSRFDVAEGEREALALALATDTLWLPDTVRFEPDPDAGANFEPPTPPASTTIRGAWESLTLTAPAASEPGLARTVS